MDILTMHFDDLGKLKASQELCPELESIALTFAGRASADQLIIAGEHLKNCEECAQAVELLRQEQDVVLLPERGAKLSRVRLRFWGIAAAALLVLGGAALLVWHGRSGRSSPEKKSLFRIKGEADRVDLSVKRDGSRFRMSPGERFQDGDELGFFYSAADPGFLALFHATGQGQVEAIFPRDGTSSARIAPGLSKALPDGAIYKSEPGCEWLIGVFANAPQELYDLEQVIEETVRQVDPATCQFNLEIEGTRTVWILPLVVLP